MLIKHGSLKNYHLCSQFIKLSIVKYVFFYFRYFIYFHCFKVIINLKITFYHLQKWNIKFGYISGNAGCRRKAQPLDIGSGRGNAANFFSSKIAFCTTNIKIGCTSVNGSGCTVFKRSTLAGIYWPEAKELFLEPQKVVCPTQQKHCPTVLWPMHGAPK